MIDSPSVTNDEISDDDAARLRHMLRTLRWGALATVRDDEPLASWVAFALDSGGDSVLLHLSRLALHTRYLMVNPRASLALCEPDRDAGADPQQLARVSLQGRVEMIVRDTEYSAQARERYLAQLPTAADNFAFADFELYRLHFAHARYVPGFGRVYRLDSAALARIAGDAPR